MDRFSVATKLFTSVIIALRSVKIISGLDFFSLLARSVITLNAALFFIPLAEAQVLTPGIFDDDDIIELNPPALPGRPSRGGFSSGSGVPPLVPLELLALQAGYLSPLGI